jgi:hypothetical protein
LSDSRLCSRGCGTTVYFDKNSPTGHPSPDKWIPLEIKEGRKTDVAHNCPRRHNGSTLDATDTTTTKAIVAKPKPEPLAFAETLLDILEDYVRLKRQELGGTAK